MGFKKRFRQQSLNNLLEALAHQWKKNLATIKETTKIVKRNIPVFIIVFLLMPKNLLPATA